MQVARHARICMHIHEGRRPALDVEPCLGFRLEREPSGCTDQDMPPGGPLRGEQLHIYATQRLSIQSQVDHAQCMPVLSAPSSSIYRMPSLDLIHVRYVSFDLKYAGEHCL